MTNNEELKAIEFTSCNCDVQGNFNCLMHNPNHPMHIIKTLRAQLAQLQSEAIEQAALVESDKTMSIFAKGLHKSLHDLIMAIPEESIKESKELQLAMIQSSTVIGGYNRFIESATSQPLPTDFGAKALELVRSDLAYRKLAAEYIANPDEGGALFEERLEALEAADKRHDQAAASFTESERNMIMGG